MLNMFILTMSWSDRWHPYVFIDGSDLPTVPWEASDRRAAPAGSSATCWHERLGGAAITISRSVGRRCWYPLAQTTASLRLLLIVSGNNLDCSCPGDGGCCDGLSSPCLPLLGAGVPVVLNHKNLQAFLLPLKQKHFVQTNHHKPARFASWNIIIKPSSDFITHI